MRWFCLGGAIASLWFFWAIGRGEAQGVVAIRLTAAPEVVLADGTSTSIIRADVRDGTGMPAPDGTEIAFNTTLGAILPTGRTVGGVAQVNLLSPTQPGTATVIATFENVRGEVSVEFVNEREIQAQESNVISVEAGWIGYYAANRMLVALQNVKLTYQNLEVDAKTSLFLDLGNMEFLGREVQLSSSGKSVEGFAARVQLSGHGLRGHLLQVDNEMRVYEIQDRALTLKRADEDLKPELFWPPEAMDTSFWVKASQALVFPGEKIALRRAELYFGESRVLKMPYYILALDQFSPTLPAYVNYSSLGGLSVDFPVNYAVTQHRTGTISIEKGRRTDWLQGRPGWSLGVEEEYSKRPQMEGDVRVEGLTRNDWGAYWTHHQRYPNGSNGYFSFGYPSHRLVYASAAVYGQGREHSFVASANVTKMPGQGASYSTLGSWRSLARPMGSGDWSYYGSLDLGLASLGDTGRAVLRQEERVAVFPRQVALGRETSLSFRTDLSLAADSTGARGAGWAGRLGIDQRLGNTSRLSLAYLYQENQGDEFLALPSRQQLSASMFWGAGIGGGGYLNATYDPSDGYISAFAGMTNDLSSNLRVELHSQYVKLPSGDYVDNEVSLVKNIGGRAAALGWSQSRHQIWFEFLPGRL